MKKNKKELITSVNAEMESQIIRKENYKLWSRIGIAVSIIIAIIIVSCIIDIYKFFADINEWLGYASLVIIAILLIIFVIIPIIKVIKAPTFTLDSSKDTKNINNLNYRTMKSVAKNLIKDVNSIPYEEKAVLESKLSNRYELRDELNFIYKKYIKKDIAKIIWLTSSKVACATGISKNNRFDAATTILCNIRMIMKIVVKCGYRPSYTKLSKLIVKVFRNALIAYTIQSANIGEIIINCCGKFFKGLPAIGKPVGAIMEGAANGFFTARIGIITRKYLYSEFDMQSKILSIDEVEELISKEASMEAEELIKENGEVND